jgi:putative spermidine/putrescine transport system ATP-binding protein
MSDASPAPGAAPTAAGHHLEVVALDKRYRGAAQAAVAAVSFTARPGELVTLLGPSGCGKSTTLRIVAGFEHPDAGQVRLDGADVTAVPASRRGVGMVFQSYALFPNLSVRENVAFGLRLRRRPDDEVRRRVADLLDLVRLGDLGDRAPHQLSGGQQQRVALARALAVAPRLLLLDEPLAALDAVIRQELRVEIRRIQARLGTTTIYVTHDQEEALSLSDQVVVMNQGRVEQVGPPAEIYGAPRTAFVAGFVGRLNVVAAEVTAAPGTVRAAGGTIDLGRPLDAAPGTAVRLAMRPESLRFDDQAAGPNRLGGIVDEVEFLGAVVLIHVRAGEDRLTVQALNTPGAPLPRVAEAVRVEVAPAAVLVL